MQPHSLTQPTKYANEDEDDDDDDDVVDDTQRTHIRTTNGLKMHDSYTKYEREMIERIRGIKVTIRRIIHVSYS